MNTVIGCADHFPFDRPNRYTSAEIMNVSSDISPSFFPLLWKKDALRVS
jgi:hypothetical protein